MPDKACCTCGTSEVRSGLSTVANATSSAPAAKQIDVSHSASITSIRGGRSAQSASTFRTVGCSTRRREAVITLDILYYTQRREVPHDRHGKRSPGRSTMPASHITAVRTLSRSAGERASCWIRATQNLTWSKQNAGFSSDAASKFTKIAASSYCPPPPEFPLPALPGAL